MARCPLHKPIAILHQRTIITCVVSGAVKTACDTSTKQNSPLEKKILSWLDVLELRTIILRRRQK